MHIELSDTLYDHAEQLARGKHSTAAREIERWALLGKAMLDNPVLDPTLVQAIVDYHSQGRIGKLPPFRWNARTSAVIRETAAFRQSFDDAGAGVTDLLGLELFRFEADNARGSRLNGDLRDYRLTALTFQALRLEIISTCPQLSSPVTLVALGRRYVGL
ncbi:hypothetical protein [Burkholderia multivorans]|uniref:ParD-like antitoxin of type II toxin-antitoxin system n=1 Tax=Burkholderia multivorans TaxID=87883 RepID=A0AB37B3U1_9BURK|nr:hypothetical protein [Burkholderia multivorans]PRE49526.1 hypothetical protein C6P97_12545 [Burkholderia multivorans]PRE55972.1 hypothetical protein C6P99_00975 [Burkholderia multivorans]